MLLPLFLSTSLSTYCFLFLVHLAIGDGIDLPSIVLDIVDRLVRRILSNNLPSTIGNPLVSLSISHGFTCILCITTQGPWWIRISMKQCYRSGRERSLIASLTASSIPRSTMASPRTPPSPTPIFPSPLMVRHHRHYIAIISIFYVVLLLGRLTLNQGGNCQISGTQFPNITADSEDITIAVSTEVVSCAMQDLYDLHNINDLFLNLLSTTPFKFDNRIQIAIELLSAPLVNFTVRSISQIHFDLGFCNILYFRITEATMTPSLRRWPSMPTSLARRRMAVTHRSSHSTLAPLLTSRYLKLSDPNESESLEVLITVVVVYEVGFGSKQQHYPHHRRCRDYSRPQRNLKYAIIS